MMPRLSFIIAAALAASCSTLSLAQETTTKAGRQFALLIGVSEYSVGDLRALPHAENDLAALAQTLESAGYPKENILLMTPKAEDRPLSPISGNINQQVIKLIRELKPEDSLLVVLSGHSVQFKGKNDSFFCPADAQLNNPGTLVSFSRLYAALDKLCKAQSITILADVCHADPLADNASPPAAHEAVSRPQKVTPPERLDVLFSCSEGQTAQVAELPKSVFFHFVMEAIGGAGDLNKDNAVSTKELEIYVTLKTQEIVESKLQAQQLPQRFGDVRGAHLFAQVVPAQPKPFEVASNSSGERSPTPNKPKPDTVASAKPEPSSSIPDTPPAPDTPADEPKPDSPADKPKPNSPANEPKPDAPDSKPKADTPADEPKPESPAGEPKADKPAPSPARPPVPPEAPDEEPTTSPGPDAPSAPARPSAPPEEPADSGADAEAPSEPKDEDSDASNETSSSQASRESIRA